MKPVKFAALVAAVSLSTIGAAHAAVLTSPPLNSDSSQHFHCSIANLGTKAIEITNVEVIGFSGTVVSSTGAFTLDAGQITNANNGTDTDAYCRFTFKGSPKKVRAGLSVEDSAGFMTMFLPAT